MKQQKIDLDVVRSKAKELNITAQSHGTKHILWLTHSSDPIWVAAATFLTLAIPVAAVAAFFLESSTSSFWLGSISALLLPFWGVASSASDRYRIGKSKFEVPPIEHPPPKSIFFLEASLYLACFVFVIAPEWLGIVLVPDRIVVYFVDAITEAVTLIFPYLVGFLWVYFLYCQIRRIKTVRKVWGAR